jgi:3-oxoacyl-[acyl-carrier protein] reductase
MADLRGEVALVTGAGRGIGAATAELLAARGARVVLAARTEKEIVATAAKIAGAGGSALPVRADVTSEAEVAALFREARERFGTVTLLVNNAGDVKPAPLVSMTLDAWRATLDANLTSTFLCSRAAVPGMVEAKRGKIVNVASVSGLPNVEKYPGFTAYASSKAAQIAFTEALAEEVAPSGVKVFCVSPASVATPLFARVAPGVEAAMSPEQVARVIALLATDDAAAANGANVVVWGK